MSDIVLNLDKPKKEMLKNLEKFKADQQKIVDENPFIQITDNKSYDQAKKHRTALVKARTQHNEQVKTITQSLNSLKNEAITYIEEEIVAISKPAEEKQQAEVKRWEKIKEEEKEAKKEEERLRIQNIDDKIKENVQEIKNFINSIEFKDLPTIDSKFQALIYPMTTDFDFMEFESEMELKITELDELFVQKKNDVKYIEQQRVENLAKTREAEINEFYRVFSLKCNNSTLTNVDHNKEKMENEFKLMKNEGFGDKEPKLIETNGILEQLFDDKKSQLLAEAQQKEEENSRAEETKQRQMLMNLQGNKLRELLSMDADDYLEKRIVIDDFKKQYSEQFNLVPDEFNEMVKLFDSTQLTKMESISKVLEQREIDAKNLLDNRLTILKDFGLEDDGETIKGWNTEYTHKELVEIPEETFAKSIAYIEKQQEDSIFAEDRAKRIGPDKEVLHNTLDTLMDALNVSEIPLEQEETINFAVGFQNDFQQFILNKSEELKNL